MKRTGNRFLRYQIAAGRERPDRVATSLSTSVETIGLQPARTRQRGPINGCLEAVFGAEQKIGGIGGVSRGEVLPPRRMRNDSFQMSKIRSNDRSFNLAVLFITIRQSSPATSHWLPGNGKST